MAALNHLQALPESVRDSKLKAEFRYDGQQQYIFHPQGTRGRAKHRGDLWVRVKTLGAGGFGSVDLQSKESSSPGLPTELRAVKSIRIPEAELLSNRDFYVRELETIAKFSSPRFGDMFVKSLGWFTSEDTIHIAMEYCKLGDLQMFLFNKCPGHRLPEDHSREIASQVLEAIFNMHEEDFAHRDIKPANILIQCHPPESRWLVKVADFGISRRSLGREMDSTTTRRGTPTFWPPELHGFLAKEKSTNLYAIDMWCFGETIFRLLAGRAAFSNVAELSKYVFGQTSFPEAILKDNTVSDEAIEFLKVLFSCNPGDRLSASDALEHPWLGQDFHTSHWESFNTPTAEGLNAFGPSYFHQETSRTTTDASAVWPTRTSAAEVETARQSRPQDSASISSFAQGQKLEASLNSQPKQHTTEKDQTAQHWKHSEPMGSKVTSASESLGSSGNGQPHPASKNSSLPYSDGKHGGIESYPETNLEIRQKLKPLSAVPPKQPDMEGREGREMLVTKKEEAEPNPRLSARTLPQSFLLTQKRELEATQKNQQENVGQISNGSYITRKILPSNARDHSFEKGKRQPEGKIGQVETEESIKEGPSTADNHKPANGEPSSRGTPPIAARSPEIAQSKSDEEVELPKRNLPITSVTERRSPVPSHNSPSGMLTSLKSATTTSNSSGILGATRTGKELPEPPSVLAPQDRIASMNSRLNMLATRRRKLTENIKLSTDALPPITFFATVEEIQNHEEDKRKIESLVQELSVVQQEEYELGLKIHRAYRRQDRESQSDRTNLWIKRVTSS